MLARSLLLAITLAAAAGLAGCAGAPRAPAPASALAAGSPAARTPVKPRMAAVPDPDLERPQRRKLLSIDWGAVPLATEADALAVWAQIAPTGEDWEEKLDEVPAAATRPLAVALLRSGNFTCMKPAPASDCAPPVYDVDQPAHAAGLAEPCLRRLLALWSIAQLEVNDFPKVRDALRGIAAIPPPESQLVATALHRVPEWEHAALLELIVIAARAGQRDVVASAVGRLEEAELIEAATRHHIDAALEVLSAEGHRAAYLAAVTDEDMVSAGRTQAITELLASGAPLDPELRAALVKATGSKDCAVAAHAARALELRGGDRRYVPTRPRARTPEALLRGLCVLASYEPLQQADEPSLLATYAPPRGLERALVEYDALSDVDTDGDGDPHTRRSIDLVPRAELAVPEVEDLARAMQRCQGSVCTSPDREFRFTWKSIGGELWLSRLTIVERPPCRVP